jgi:hypothetical protein
VIGIIVLLAVLAFCMNIARPNPGSGNSSSGGSGSSLVYQRINSMTDCGDVQTQFDIAAENNDRATPGTDQHRQSLDYMEAADARLRALGCY